MSNPVLPGAPSYPNTPPAAAPTGPLIYGKLAAITAEIGKLPKLGRGPSTQNSYPFLALDTILEHLNPLLGEHGVAVVSRMTAHETTIETFSKVDLDGKAVADGRPTPLREIVNLQYSLDFYAIEDGSMVTATAWGESHGSDDKGTRKAASQAHKEILLRTFSITSGEEDPDALDSSQSEAVVARQDRGAQMRQRAAKAPAPKVAPPKAPEPQPEPSPAPAPAPEPVAAAEPTFTPDPADIAAAEQQVSAAAPVAPPAAPVPAPVAAPPKTQADAKAEDVAELRKNIREALIERELTREVANALGDQITGKPRATWFGSPQDLRRVLNAIRAGEMPDEASF